MDFSYYISFFISSLIAAIITIYFINTKAYDEQGNLICDNYVLNTYLYILLSLILLGIISIIFIYMNFYNTMLQYLRNINILMLIFIMIIYVGLIIGCYVLLKKLNPVTQSLLIHIIWLILLLLFTLSFISTVLLGIKNNTFIISIIIVMIITAITGIIGYKYGEKFIPYDFNKYVFWGLIIFIVLKIVTLQLIKNDKLRKKINYIFAIISIAILILLLLSYHNTLRENANNCNINNPPNYPNEAMNLLIKLIELNKNVVILLGKRKRNKLIF